MTMWGASSFNSFQKIGLGFVDICFVKNLIFPLLEVPSLALWARLNVEARVIDQHLLNELPHGGVGPIAPRNNLIEIDGYSFSLFEINFHLKSNII